ncbi:MAG: hypothetical protein ACOYN2_00515 [Patescibacteria group bacterium]
MFGKSGHKALTKRGIKKMDALVTGLILGGIVASIYGIKRADDQAEKTKENILRETDKHTIGSVVRMLVFGVEKPKKEGIIKRIFSRFSPK